LTLSLAAEIRRVAGANDGWLFPGKKNGHLAPQRVGDLVSEALGDYTMHQLRHLFGTEVYGETQDLRLVQQMLGHVSITTTTGYVGISAGKARDSVLDRAERWNRIPNDKPITPTAFLDGGDKRNQCEPTYYI